LERDITAERFRAGLRRARNNGKRLGRPSVKVDKKKLLRLHSQGLSTRQIAARLGLKKSTAASLVKNLQRP